VHVRALCYDVSNSAFCLYSVRYLFHNTHTTNSSYLHKYIHPEFLVYEVGPIDQERQTATSIVTAGPLAASVNITISSIYNGLSYCIYTYIFTYDLQMRWAAIAQSV
jgi:hypothetical protein